MIVEMYAGARMARPVRCAACAAYGPHRCPGDTEPAREAERARLDAQAYGPFEEAVVHDDRALRLRDAIDYWDWRDHVEE